MPVAALADENHLAIVSKLSRLHLARRRRKTRHVFFSFRDGSMVNEQETRCKKVRKAQHLSSQKRLLATDVEGKRNVAKPSTTRVSPGILESHVPESIILGRRTKAPRV